MQEQVCKQWFIIHISLAKTGNSIFKESLVQTNINSLFIIQGVPYCYAYYRTSFAGTDGW